MSPALYAHFAFMILYLGTYSENIFFRESHIFIGAKLGGAGGALAPPLFCHPRGFAHEIEVYLWNYI